MSEVAARLKRGVEAWVALWDERELPTAQALVRIGLAVVMLSDLLVIAWLDLVVPLFGTVEAGGWSNTLDRRQPALWYVLFAPSPGSAWLLWGGMVASTLSLLVGLRTRLSALVLLLLSAQFAQIMPPADRGIDMLIRNVLAVLVFASAGRAWSVDAWMRSGSFRGDGHEVPAWPRYLLILQLVVMYFTAGVQKATYLWTPMGSFDALYVILQDPAMARFDGAFLAHEPWLTLTRVGTAGTLVWEYSAPLMLLVYFWRRGGGGGRVGRWVVEKRAHYAWIAVGVLFHLALAGTLELGIFPWAMLALYPVFFHPTELQAGLDWLDARFAPIRARVAPGSESPAP